MIERQLHPGFWWIWATILICALLRLESLTLNLIAAFGILLIYRFAEVPDYRRAIFTLVLKLTAIALLIRMIFAFFIGVPMPGKTLFVLPQLQLPEFLVGIRIGGAVTSDRLLGALSEATLFGALLLAFGLANALSTPTRLIKILPARLHGLGTATTLATTIIPSVTRSVERVRIAQFLRGQGGTGLRSWRRVATPVLEDSLTRSIDLSASLEARGYGINPNPTRYRPESWGTAETIAIIAMAYLVFVFPFLALPFLLKAAIFIFLLMIPAVLR